MSPLVLLGRRIPQMSSPKIAATLLSTRAELALKVARAEAVAKQRDYVAAQLAALQLELDILNSEHAALQAQCSTLSAACDTLLPHYVRTIFGSICDELLLLIFDEYVSNADVGRYRDVDRGTWRPDAPFLLSSVSRRWRSLAINTPRLWVCVGLATARSVHHRRWDVNRERLQASVSRCRGRPLDIFGADASQLGPHGFAYFLESVAQYCGAFDLRLSDTLTIRCLSPLQAPTPHLTSMRISGGVKSLFGGPHDPQLRLFLFAPHLRRVELDGNATSLIHVMDGPYPALQHLALYKESYAEFKAWINLVGEQLTELKIEGNYRPEQIQRLHGNARIRLPRVTKLTTCNLSIVSPDNFPLLCDLTVIMGDEAISMPADAFIGRPITHLTLLGRAQSWIVQALKPLTQMSHLVLGRSIHGPDGDLSFDPEFFADLADTTPPIWPKLMSIVLQDAPLGALDDDVMLDVQHDLLALIDARNKVMDVDESDVTQSRPAKLQEITFPPHSQPAWFKAELDRVMRQ